MTEQKSRTFYAPEGTVFDFAADGGESAEIRFGKGGKHATTDVGEITILERYEALGLCSAKRPSTSKEA